MPRFIVSDEAREDMAEIWSYIAADSEDAANRLVATFHDRFEALADNPMMGRSRSELLPNLRSFPAGSYLIFYHPIEDGVEILHVIHGARDIRTLF
jgi:toxin ParE1/3/4